MIVFNGEILDTYENTLKGLVVKKSLASINNLSDRKGTASTEFDLPRTANNELIFENATVIGSINVAVGDASILIDNNVNEVGKMYLRRFNDNSISAVFIGNDMDFIGETKVSFIKDLFFNTTTNTYDSTEKTSTAVRTAAGVKYINYNYGANLTGISGLNAGIAETGIAINISDTIKKIVESKGYNFFSNFFTGAYGANLYYSSFEGNLLNKNTVGGDDYSRTSLTVNDSLSFTGSSGSAISIISNPLPGGVGGEAIQLATDTKKIRLRFNISDLSGLALNGNFSTLFISIQRLSGGLWSPIEERESKIPSGTTMVDLLLERDSDFLTNDIILFYITPFDGAGQLYTIGNILVQTDLQVGQSFDPFDTLKNMTQYDFLKLFLDKFNMMIVAVGDDIIIECAEQYEIYNFNGGLVDFSGGLLSGIVDITDKVQDNVNVEIDASNFRAIYFTEEHVNKVYANSFSFFNFEELGSYFHETNSYNQIQIENIKSPYNSGVTSVNQSTWDNVLFLKADNDFNGSVFTFNYKAVWENYTKPTFFNKRLQLIGSSYIRSINLYDHTGALMDFRNKYIIENQVYKLLEYQYDIQTKAVNAKIQLI
jgi:hypothetical protein